MKTGIALASLGLVTALAACGAASAPASRVPGCTSAVTRAPRLAGRPRFVPLPGTPFAAVASRDGRHVFVSMPGKTGGKIGVLARRSGSWRLVRTVAVPMWTWGLALDPTGGYLLVADGAGIAVLDPGKLVAGAGDPVASFSPTAADGSVEVAVAPRRRLAFASDEFGGTVSVFALGRTGAPRPRLVGRIRVPPDPVGMALSSDGRTLYVTSETNARNGEPGMLSVVDVAGAVRAPAHAVVASVPAGCSPVRVAVAPDGGTVWVTARGSDALLAYSASRHPALRAVVRVGRAPVGLAFLGRFVLVADSNRFAGGTAPQTVSVVDAGAALAGRHAVLGELPAGAFPREVSVLPASSGLVVTNFASHSLELVPAAVLPH